MCVETPEYMYHSPVDGGVNVMVLKALARDSWSHEGAANDEEFGLTTVMGYHCCHGSHGTGAADSLTGVDIDGGGWCGSTAISACGACDDEHEPSCLGTACGGWDWNGHICMVSAHELKTDGQGLFFCEGAPATTIVVIAAATAATVSTRVATIVGVVASTARVGVVVTTVVTRVGSGHAIIGVCNEGSSLGSIILAFDLLEGEAVRVSMKDGKGLYIDKRVRMNMYFSLRT